MTGCGEVVLLHSSDLHLVQERGIDGSITDNLVLLERVLATASRLRVDVILLAGDVFDHNRVNDVFVKRAADQMAHARTDVVILPGNHDPLVAESVYYRGLGEVANVHVLGLVNRELDIVHLPQLDLDVWGKPHVDYSDMAPLGGASPRRARWHVAMAHGHFETASAPRQQFRASWLISPEQIEATGADYVALGHWNRRACVGSVSVPAYYSGSPEYCDTVNIVRLRAGGPAAVSQESLVR